MGGIALLARAAGHSVSGSDRDVYPPMSTQLQAANIPLLQGYDAAHFHPAPECVIVGNALTRGNPAVEYLLDHDIPYTSGPQWLAEHLLRGQHVLAVAGTHGKTTTASLLAWILEYAELSPGFLIGGVPQNFGVSARPGSGAFFVVEADEYDTAFFDKRSKFVHYRPHTLILNNLEFDHADIFPDLAAIKRQFHHLLRTVPGKGLIITNGADRHLEEVLKLGHWTRIERFTATSPASDWEADKLAADGSRFDVLYRRRRLGTATSPLLGAHNVANALAAVAAAHNVGVPVTQALAALAAFRGVKRRLEIRAKIAGVTLYDDFAHHPTAIAATVQALRAHVGKERIVVLLELRSNTMRMGVHKDHLAAALTEADKVLLYQPGDLDWDIGTVVEQLPNRARVFSDVDVMIAEILHSVQEGELHVLIMSNGAFGGVHERLLAALQ